VVLAAHVTVQGHGGHTQLDGDTPHRHRGQSFTIRDADGGGDHGRRGELAI
jgi:hypothetical protein